ncbi:hypothetical protein UK23_43090 [Lentzea aerocolonigenes]|uniref:Uncharacterized protein n=1 Tax=Lentzea aerocolonigenes TaxID=68170 RepID=A0A0F0GIR2_LENAE|nr:hypothetical protein UK23_43090 [Lentzea aerocolonigenes]
MEERIEILSALCRAGDCHIEITGIIAASPNEAAATAALRKRLDTTESGARAVLEMQLRRLVPDLRDRLRAELEELRAQAARDRA